MNTTGKITAPDTDHRDWGQLNAHLLECVMAKVAGSGDGSSLAFKDMLGAAGVNHHWRSVASAALLNDSSWQGQATIRHPAQLSTLCPLASAPGGLIKGQVRREACGWGLRGRLQRLTFYQTLHSSTGEAGLCGKFLLAAEQQGSGDWAVYFDRKCRGKPVAHLTCNALRTTYTLTAGGSSFGCSCSCCNNTVLDRSSSSSSSSISDSSGSSNSSSSKGLAGLKGLSRLSRGSSRSLWSCSSSSFNSIKNSSCHIDSSNIGSSSSSAAPSPSSSCNSIVSGHPISYPEGVESSPCTPPRVQGNPPVHRHHVVPDCETQNQQEQQQQQQHTTRFQPASCQVEAGNAHTYLACSASTVLHPHSPKVDTANTASTASTVAHTHSPKAGTAWLSPYSAAVKAGGVSGPQVLMVLQYRLHLKAMVLPRRMSVMLSIPHTAMQQCACSHTVQTGPPPPAAAAARSQCAQHRLESAPHKGQHCWRPGAAAAPVLTHLQNKQPQWNDAQRVWCLNFNGRVKLSSAKNFQLVSAQEDSVTAAQHQAAALPGEQPDITAADTADMANAPTDSSSSSSQAAPLCCCGAAGVPRVLQGSPGAEGVVVQFGKTDMNAFILDYDPCVCTALQTFAVALTSFGTKLLA